MLCWPWFPDNSTRVSQQRKDRKEEKGARGGRICTGPVNSAPDKGQLLTQGTGAPSTHVYAPGNKFNHFGEKRGTIILKRLRNQATAPLATYKLEVRGPGPTMKSDLADFQPAFLMWTERANPGIYRALMLIWLPVRRWPLTPIAGPIQSHNPTPFIPIFEIKVGNEVGNQKLRVRQLCLTL